MGARLTPRGPDIWTVDAPLRVMGLRIGARMTVVRLPDGGLWLHSPVAIDDALAAELAALGPVRHLVGPNTMHHLGIPSALARYPEARLHLSPALAAKRPALAPAALLEGEAPEAWGGVLTRRALAGAPRLGEHVFLHAPARALIVTDLAFNFTRVDDWWTRTVFRFNRALGGLGPTRILLSTVDDRAAAKASVAALCAEWDFDLVVVSHGEVATEGAREQLAAAWAAV